VLRTASLKKPQFRRSVVLGNGRRGSARNCENSKYFLRAGRWARETRCATTWGSGVHRRVAARNSGIRRRWFRLCVSPKIPRRDHASRRGRERPTAQKARKRPTAPTAEPVCASLSHEPEIGARSWAEHIRSFRGEKTPGVGASDIASFPLVPRSVSCAPAALIGVDQRATPQCGEQ
jgi:hypothetical protein